GAGDEEEEDMLYFILCCPLLHYECCCIFRRHGRASMEGRLLKFTNLMKGYRYRWVVLNDEEGTLQYYESKESKKSPPKGCMFLG
ncbi:unnamed protein product, partial [Candidula unifasciata]